MSEPLQFGFEYEIRLAVSIPIAWATLLKEAAKHHYDYKCREAGERGVVNALYNTAQGGELQSNYPVTWRDLDLVTKVAEQLHHHTKDHALILAIRKWLHETQDTIVRQRTACEALPRTIADKAPERGCPHCGCKLADAFRAELEHHVAGCPNTPIGADKEPT